MSRGKVFSLLDSVLLRTIAIENYIAICRTLDDAKEEHEKHAAEAKSEDLWCCRLMQCLRSDSSWFEERIFRHRNIVIQLYSIYEWFSEEALGQWLAQLPRHHKFVDLSPQFQNTYRHGISLIIGNIGKGRYKHLDLGDILERYSTSIKGDSSWNIVDEAIVVHESNLRREAFVTLYAGAGFENIWHSLEQSDPIAKYKSERDLDRSLEQMILDLVDYRNDANHGQPDEIISLEGLGDWLKFVVVFCEALANIVVHRMVAASVAVDKDVILGTVTERLSDNIVVVTCDRGEFQVGEEICFFREKDCSVVKIESIQLDDVDHRSVKIDAVGTEIGLKVSGPVAKNSQVLKFSDA